ncbi:hypothetical protein BKA93DRAFT_830792 [Sparassis latifolia]
MNIAQVVRQGAFIDMMHELGLTKRGYFNNSEDERAFVHTTARYHELDVVNLSRSLFLVPTLDIDFVRHSHQLMGSRYEEDYALCQGPFGSVRSMFPFYLLIQYHRLRSDNMVKEDWLAMSLDMHGRTAPTRDSARLVVQTRSPRRMQERA